MARLIGLQILFVLGAWLAAPAARAQAWQRDPLLSELLIHGLVQDPAGLLWVATDRGVFRYDGYALVALRELVRPPAPAAVGYVLALALDGRGRLWMGGSQGLFRFDVARGTLQQLALPGIGRAPVNVTAVAVHSRSQAVWVAYGDTALAYFRAGAGPARAVPTGLTTPAAWLGPADDTSLWVVTGRHRVARVSLVARALKPYQPHGALLPVPGTQPQQLVGTHALYEEQPDGTLRERDRWLPGADEPNFVPGQTGQTGRTWQWVVAGYHVQLDWPAAAAGLPRAVIRRVTFEPTEQPRRPFTVYTDATGLRWSVGNNYRGCYKERPATTSIEPLVSRPLARYSTRAITRLPDGRLLVGAYGATLVQDADSSLAALHPLPLTESGAADDGGAADGAGPDNRDAPVLLDVLTATTGTVLFAEENHPFGVLDAYTRQIQRFTWVRPARVGVGSLCVFEDRRGRLWGGSTRGLYRLDPATHRATPWQAAGADGGLASQSVHEMTEDALGNLWLATQGGLYRIDAHDEVTHFGTAQRRARYLPTDDLLTVWTQDSDELWLGTRDQGLVLFDPRRGVQRHLSTENGLPSNSVATILPGKDGELWCGTYAGLVRYDIRANRLTVLTAADGLTEAELNRQSAWRDPDGTLYFGGVSGVHRVRPTPRASTPPPPPWLLLTAISQHHGSADTTRVRYPTGRAGAELVLAPADAFVELSLALTDYLAPDRARFRYRLLGGANERWHTLGSTHVLTLQGVPPGRYQLEVEGTAGHGVPARNQLRLEVRVEAEWWRHPLLWALASTLVAGGLYLAHRRRVARVRREERLRNRAPF